MAHGKMKDGVTSQNVLFNKENVGAAIAILNRQGLDYRFILGRGSEAWESHQSAYYAAKMGDQEIYIVPGLAVPELHMGMRAVSEMVEGTPIVRTYMEDKSQEKPLALETDVIVIDYTCLTAIQVRGLKVNGEPKTIFITCTVNNWDAMLEKELTKLRIINLPAYPLFAWDAISDAMVI